MLHQSIPTQMSASLDRQQQPSVHPGVATLWLLGVTACAAVWGCAGWLLFA
jgi:hypothetical protein